MNTLVHGPSDKQKKDTLVHGPSAKQNLDALVYEKITGIKVSPGTLTDMDWAALIDAGDLCEDLKDYELDDEETDSATAREKDKDDKVSDSKTGRKNKDYFEAFVYENHMNSDSYSNNFVYEAHPFMDDYPFGKRLVKVSLNDNTIIEEEKESKKKEECFNTFGALYLEKEDKSEKEEGSENKSIKKKKFFVPCVSSRFEPSPIFDFNSIKSSVFSLSDDNDDSLSDPSSEDKYDDDISDLGPSPLLIVDSKLMPPPPLSSATGTVKKQVKKKKKKSMKKKWRNLRKW